MRLFVRQCILLFCLKLWYTYAKGSDILKELLSPAGNMECLKAAVLNGADAVYLGGKSFGARAYAGNFSDEEW